MFVFFLFVLHRKTHCIFFNPSHYSYSHSSCQDRFLGKPPKYTHLTTYHRRISANASKQGKKATVSTARCVFQWHATQHGLAINYLEAGENIEGNSLLTQQNDKWYLQLNTSWHCFPCKYVFQLHCFILSIVSLLPIVRPFVPVWINWSQCP